MQGIIGLVNIGLQVGNIPLATLDATESELLAEIVG